MRNTMRVLFFILVSFFVQTTFGQTDSSLYYFKEIGWSIKLPSDFKIVDSATRVSNIAKGKSAVEVTLNKEINMTKLTHLISAAKDNLNYFAANILNSALVTSENWESADNSSNEVLFKTMNRILKNFEIDTSNTLIIIDGVRFKKFQAICIIPNKNKQAYFSQIGTFHKEQYFSVSYFYLDKALGDEIENMLMTSKFDK